MSLSVKSKLITSFCAVAAMIAVVIVLTNYNLGRMNDATDEVDRSHQVITDLTRMREALINMETGARGFALSGKESFLEPVQIGEQELQQSFQEALANTKIHSAARRSNGWRPWAKSGSSKALCR